MEKMLKRIFYNNYHMQRIKLTEDNLMLFKAAVNAWGNFEDQFNALVGNDKNFPCEVWWYKKQAGTTHWNLWIKFGRISDYTTARDLNAQNG